MKAGTRILLLGSLAGLIWSGGCTSRERKQTSNTEKPAPAQAPERPAIVPLPELDLESFEASVRQKVRPLYDQARTSPADPDAVGKLGMMLHALRRWPEAELCYQRARGLAPKEFRWTYYLSIVSEARNKRARALVLLREASELSPDYAPLKVRLAGLLLDDGDLDESEKNYRQAIRMDPQLAAAYYGLGKLLAARGDWAAAAENDRHACSLDKSYAAAYYALGLACKRLGKTGEAQAALRRYEQLKDRPEPAYDSALNAVTAMFARGGKSPRPNLQLSSSGLRKVAEELETALKEQPTLVSAHSSLIGIYWELGQPEKSKQHYLAGIRIDPKDPLLRYNWGVTRLLKGDLDAAEQAFQKALALNPRYSDAHVQYGVLLERRHQISEAVKHYRLALAANPNHRRGNLRLGIALVRSGQTGEGIRCLRETIKIEDRQTPRYMFVLAEAYQAAGDREHALHYFHQARERAARFHFDDLIRQIDAGVRALPSEQATR